MPPIRGILRSVMTIEGAHWLAFSSPSAPSRAVSTRNPHEDTSSANPDRSFSSSSTINIFSWLIGTLVLYLVGSSSASHPGSKFDGIPKIRGLFAPGKVWDNLCALPTLHFETKPSLPRCLFVHCLSLRLRF